MPLPTQIAESFHWQAEASVMLGSPFMALVCRLLADRLETDSLFAWEGDAPSWTTPLTIAERAGCDMKPIDPRSKSDRDRLLSYIWPDQFARLSRIEAALAAAAQSVFSVERADAANWLEKRLAVDGSTGRTRVVFHSAVWSYLSADTKERLKTAIRSAGASATSARPIAWLSIEPDGIDGSAAIRATIWPDGTTHRLGRSDHHGRWARWEAG